MRTLLFVSKKKQKNYVNCGIAARTVRRIAGAPAAIPPIDKVFLVLFVHKKNKNLPSLALIVTTNYRPIPTNSVGFRTDRRGAMPCR